MYKNEDVAKLARRLAEADDTQFASEEEAREAVKTVRESAPVLALLPIVRSKNWRVRNAAIEALHEVEPSQVEPETQRKFVSALLETPKNSNDILALSRFNDERIDEVVARALGDSSPLVRGRAVVATVERKGRGAIPVLIQIVQRTPLTPGVSRLRDLDELGVYEKAAFFLGWLKAEEGVPALIRVLRTPHVQFRAAEALGKIGDERAVMPLIEALQSQDSTDDFRIEVAKALGSIKNPRAIPALARIIESKEGEKDSLARVWAVEALGNIGDKRAIPALVKANRDGVYNALGHLVALAGMDAFDVLREEFEKGNRVGAVFLLRKLGSERVVPYLKRALGDADERAVLYAAGGLCALGDEQTRGMALAKLSEMLADEESYQKKHLGPQFRSQSRAELSLEELGRTHMAEAIPALAKAVKNLKAITFSGLDNLDKMTHLIAATNSLSELCFGDQSKSYLFHRGDFEAAGALLGDTKPLHAAYLYESAGAWDIAWPLFERAGNLSKAAELASLCGAEGNAKRLRNSLSKLAQ